jgi:predicted dehydrogenase
MSPVRVALIGCGSVGRRIHAAGLRLCPDVELALACSRSKESAEAVGASEITQDYRAVMVREDIDAVVIATPNNLHREIALAAFEAGKHVLCEKPLCLTVREAEALVARAEERSLVLMTGHVFLFNTGILKLKELTDAGHAGRLHYLRALRTNLGPVRADVNCVYDLASHDISIFMFLLGSHPLTVSAVGAAYLQPGIEDLAFITLRFPDDVLAHIQVSWLDPKKLREIVLVGDRRMIVWDDLAPTGPVHIYDKGIVLEPYYKDYGQFQLLAREGDVTIPRVSPEEPLRVQNAHFLRAVGQGMDRRDSHMAIGVLRTLEAVTASMRAGGAPIHVAT